MMDLRDSQTTLEELRWLQGLAVRLVGDVHEAADLSQEAWLAAERRRPADALRRPWLVRTLRNLASKARRAQQRRRTREARVATVEALPSADQLAERTELQRELLGHVQELPEHYRTALLLRYYDGATPRQIAEQLGVPVRTVHTRLHRGLERLRNALDAEHPEGRRRWLAAILGVPLARIEAAPIPAGSSSASAASGGLGVVALGLAVTAGIVVLGVTLWLARSDDPAPDVGPDAPEPTRIAEAPAVPQPMERRVMPEPDEPAVAVPAPDMPGMVVDWNGRPVASAEVALHELRGVRFPMTGRAALPMWGATLAAGEADAAGRFGFPVVDVERALVTAKVPDTVCAMHGEWDGVDSTYVVLAAAKSFRRRVVGHDGSILVGARVRVEFDETVAARFDFPFYGQHAGSWSTVSDQSGLVEFEAVPWVSEARLTVAHPAYPERSWSVLEAPPELVLGDGADRSVVGRVLDATGRPVADAVVESGERRVRTDAAGEFTLWSDGDTSPTLWVAATGWAPTRFEVPGDADAPRVELGDLTLSVRPTTLRGRVETAGGHPMADCNVWVHDPAGIQKGWRLALESIASGGDGVMHIDRTAADGSFALSGMVPGRKYTVRVSDPGTTLWFDSVVTPGTGPVVVQAPPRPLVSMLRGRVVDRTGRPLVGVEVGVQGPGYMVGGNGTYEHGDTARTDEDGDFQLFGVPRTGVWLRVHGPSVGHVTRPVEDQLDDEVWVVPLMARLAVRLTRPAADSTVTLLDRDGQVLSMWVPAGSGRRRSETVPIHRGRSPVIEVPTTAVTLRVESPGRREHVPLDLSPGRTHTVVH